MFKFKKMKKSTKLEILGCVVPLVIGIIGATVSEVIKSKMKIGVDCNDR